MDKEEFKCYAYEEVGHPGKRGRNFYVMDGAYVGIFADTDEKVK